MIEDWRVHMTLKGQHQVFDQSFITRISQEDSQRYLPLPKVTKIYIEPGTYREYHREFSNDLGAGKKRWEDR